MDSFVWNPTNDNPWVEPKEELPITTTNEEPLVPVSETVTQEEQSTQPIISDIKFSLYRVKPQDTLTQIAILYNETVDDLKTDNPEGIRFGQLIKVRVK